MSAIFLTILAVIAVAWAVGCVLLVAVFLRPRLRLERVLREQQPQKRENS